MREIGGILKDDWWVGVGWILMEKGYEEFADCGNNLDFAAIFIPPVSNHVDLIYKSCVKVFTKAFYTSTSNCFASEGVIGVLLLKM